MNENHDDLSIPDFLRRTTSKKVQGEYVPRPERKVVFTPYKKEVKEVVRTPVNIQASIRESAGEVIGEVEGFIDDIMADKNEFDSVYDLLSSLETKVPQAKLVLEHFQPLLKEAQLLAANSDPQVVEAYAYMNKATKDKYVNMVGSLTQDIEKYIDNQKRINPRKPRARKVPSITRQVEKVQYLQTFDELKIVSVPPDQIVGAETVWLYNTKTKTLTHLVAQKRSGFTVKGTTIQDYAEDHSETKRLRKPAIVLPKVVEGGKVQLRKVMDSIKTKKLEANGRLNKYTIILRTTKG